LRVISRERLREFWRAHPDAEAGLKSWYRIVKTSAWKSPNDLARTMNGVDPVKGSSGNTVSVFNITNNNYRLVAHFHFDKQRVFVLRVMTHKEYDREKWKDEL
jgi:mRNA interferase HigB